MCDDNNDDDDDDFDSDENYSNEDIILTMNKNTKFIPNVLNLNCFWLVLRQKKIRKEKIEGKKKERKKMNVI